MAKIKFENIVQSWDAHIPGLASDEDNFFNNFLRELELKQTGLNATWEKVGGLFGQKKRFLSVQNGPYGCYVGATVFGTDLYCTWNLYDPRFEKSKDGSFGGLFKSDFNDINNMKAFAATILDCTQNAVEAIFDKGNLGKEKLKKVSSGALGPL